jgi:hypothetical protein
VQDQIDSIKLQVNDPLTRKLIHAKHGFAMTASDLSHWERWGIASRDRNITSPVHAKHGSAMTGEVAAKCESMSGG